MGPSYSAVTFAVTLRFYRRMETSFRQFLLLAGLKPIGFTNPFHRTDFIPTLGLLPQTCTYRRSCIVDNNFIYTIVFFIIFLFLGNWQSVHVSHELRSLAYKSIADHSLLVRFVYKSVYFIGTGS